MATFPQTGPRSQGASTSSPWWIIYYEPIGVRDVPGTAKARYQILSAANKAVAEAQVTRSGAVVTSAQGPFKTKADALSAAKGEGLTNVQASGGADVTSLNPIAWFQQATGGILAGALEQGFIQIIKDLWTVVEGPIMILAGGLIIIATLAIYFKNDIGAVAGLAAMAA